MGYTGPIGPTGLTGPTGNTGPTGTVAQIDYSQVVSSIESWMQTPSVHQIFTGATGADGTRP